MKKRIAKLMGNVFVMKKKDLKKCPTKYLICVFVKKIIHFIRIDIYANQMKNLKICLHI